MRVIGGWRPRRCFLRDFFFTRAGIEYGCLRRRQSTGKHGDIIGLDLVRGIRDGGVDGVHPGAVVDPESIIVESAIGSAARVDRGARITDSLLLHGARVGADAVVHCSVVAGQIGRGAIVTDCVIGLDHLVEAGTSVTGQRLPAPD